MRIHHALTAVALCVVTAAPALARDIRIWRTGPVVAKTNGQVISNRNIRVTSGTGIQVWGLKDVRIQNCLIEYDEGTTGIAFGNAQNLEIINCEFRLRGADASGALDARSPAIKGSRSNNIEIRQVTFRECGSGIKLLQCDNARLLKLAGYNFRGPFPDGQMVQFNRCSGGLVQEFSCVNDLETSFPEDCFNVYRSAGQRFRLGLVDGNNAPSGVGILFEEQDDPNARGGTGGLVEYVDFVRMGNGAVAGADGSENITFRGVRIRDTHVEGQGGRADPRSNGLMFSGYGTDNNPGKNLKVTGAKLWNIANEGNLFFPTDSFSERGYSFQNFSPRGVINNNFNWLKQN